MGRSRRHEEEEDEDDSEAEEEEEEVAASSSKKKKKSITPPNKKYQKGSSAAPAAAGGGGGATQDEEEDAPKLYLGGSLLTKKSTRFPFTDVHRAVLQYFLAKKVVEEKDLEQVTTTLGRTADVTVKSIIETINEKLSNEDMYMQIRPREMLEDETRTRVFGIINTRSDEVAKEATNFEPWQLAIFSECLALLAKSENGIFGHIEAYHAYNALPDKIAKQYNDVLATLQKLVALGWLRNASRQNYFTAGPRSLLELSEVLRNYGASECPVSKQIVIKTEAYKKWIVQAQ